MLEGPLTHDQIEEFHENGFVLIKNYFDYENEIKPIQEAIYEIIGLVADKYNVTIPRPGCDIENFDAGYKELFHADRRYASIVYDAVKQIAPFVRLAAHEKNEASFKQLRHNALVGIAHAQYGIRIDAPWEDTFHATWHQEYPGNFRSLDGCVFWSPLRKMFDEIGPVQICPRSHKNGPIPVWSDESTGQSRAYALRLQNEEEILSTYKPVTPLSDPSDLVIMDFSTVHSSGHNVSDVPRWSMQLRYFNFRNPQGIAIDWVGSFNAGVSIEEVHPELFVGATK